MSLILAPEEIAELTGGLTLARCQVKRLQARGFVRARLERGKCVLERAHYDAVCRGQFVAEKVVSGDTPRPQLRSIKKAA